MCDQQRLRPACAYAQSDQSLCLSLEYTMIVKLQTEHHLEFVSLKGGCRGSSESTHVKMPHCWKSHALAHYFYIFKTVSNVLSVLYCDVSLWCLKFIYGIIHFWGCLGNGYFVYKAIYDHIHVHNFYLAKSKNMDCKSERCVVSPPAFRRVLLVYGIMKILVLCDSVQIVQMACV